MNKKLISSLLLPILCLTSSASAVNINPKKTSNKSVVETKSQNKAFEKVKNFVKSPTGKKSLYIGLPTLGVIGTVCIVAGIVNKKKKQHNPPVDSEKTHILENNDQNENNPEEINQLDHNLTININAANKGEQEQENEKEKEKIIEIKVNKNKNEQKQEGFDIDELLLNTFE